MAVDNKLLRILSGKQTQSSQAASSGIGRSIDSQQEAWSQSLRDQPSTFKAQSLETEDTAPKTTNPLLTFTDDWKKQQEEKSKPKKKGLFGITIPDGSENPWDYDATNNIIDTSVPATPKVEEPKPAEPEQPKSKPLEYSDAFLKQEEQKDAWQPTWSNDKTIMDKQEVNEMERAIATTTGAAKQYGSGMVNLYGTTAAGLNELGQTLGGNTNEYAGWATDPISSAMIPHEQDPAYYEREKKYTDTVQAVADSLSESAAADLEKAKQGLSKVGQFGIDVATNMIQMGFDAGLAALTGGGSALLPMFLRSTGSAEQEARQAGATTWEQIFSGNVSGGIEALTEKAFDGLAGIYGKGAADEITEEAIRKLSKTDIGRSALRLIGGMVEEGGEEVLSDLLNPFVKTIYNNKSLLDNYKDLDPSEILYDFIIGAAVSGATTGGANIATKGEINRAANNTLAATDAVENALAAEGVDAFTAEQIAPTVEKALNGEELTSKEKNILMEIRNREDVAAGSPQVENFLNEVLTAQGVETATPVGQSTSKAAQLETALDTAEQNQVNANVETTAPAEEVGRDVSKRARLETELDTAEPSTSTTEENALLAATGVTPTTETNRGVNPNKSAQIETELDKRSERIAEIQQEISDLEQQAPSAERDAEIRNLIEEQTALENGEVVEEATAQESSENAVESQEVSGNENIPAESEENLKNDLEGNTAEETSQQTATEENAGTATENEAGSQANTEQQNAPSEPFVPTVNQEAQGGKTRVSETSTNTLTNVAEQNGGTQAPITYLTQTEAQTLNEAMNRVDTNMVGEMNGLASKETWTATDIDTALTIQSRIMFDAVKSGDYSAAEAWAKVVQQHGTEAARALQALGKWARTGSAAYADAINQIDKADNLTDEQKTNLKKQVGEFAQQYDSVEDGDFDSLISLILKQNGVRKTGTFADGNFEKILRKIKDYNWLKEYALRQLMSIPADYTDTATFAQKAKTWQVNSQLTRLGTFFRNLGGNASFGVLDIFSQDGFGYAIDSLLSKITGRKEVGFDKGWLSRKARSAAVDAANKSILEIAGDVDMGRDTSKYGTTSNRTNKMVGGTQFERFMSRWEQLLGYSLNTSDRFFRGQLEQSYAEALQQQVEQGNMTQAEAEKLAQMMADYRLFQNEGLAAKFSKGAHNVLNLFGFGGEVRGAERQGGFGLGDLVNPYPGVPANLAVKLLEYSPANIAKGGLEIVKLIRDAKNGKTVTGQQMQAAMDVARGLTGMGVVALFSALAKSGLFRNSDDEEDYDVMTAQGAQGLSGVQWNLDATVRSLSGGKADWKDGDTLMKVSWLEPLNAFMAVASLIADEEDDADLATKAGDYMQGAIQAFLDLPVMENIQNTVNTFKYATGDNIFDRAGQGAAAFAGGALSGMIPAPISQLARVTDDYYRDTSGSTKAEAAVNSLLNSIPGARNTLPVKTDNFGNEKLNEPNALLRTLNSFVLPGAINTFMQTDVQEAVAEVYEATGKASVYPDRKGVKNLSYDGKQYDLTEEEQKAYHETAGQKSEQYISAFINSDYYDDLTDEQRADIITALNSDAKDYAKYEYLKGQKVKADNPETKNQATMTALKTLGNKANGSFKSGRETDYETLDYIVKNIYPNLTKAEKDALNSAGSYGRYDNMYDCSKVGIDSKTFEKFLNKAKEIDKNSHSYTINAEEYAAYVDKQKGLTSAQRSALKDIYKYTTTLVADTKTYDKWVNAGLSYDDAVGFNKKIDTNGNNSKSNQEIFAAIEQYAKDAEMAEKLWEAANSSSWSKSGKSYFKANPSSKFRSSWSGKTYSTPSSKGSSSSKSTSTNNDLLDILSGKSTGSSSSGGSSGSSSGTVDNNLLAILSGKG